MKKKYCVSYVSGATGYGWEMYHDRLDEFEDFINEHREDYSCRISVWDSTLEEFIFWKRCFEEPDIDKLADIMRDMRTTTRKMKDR